MTRDTKTVCLFANIGTGHLNPMLVLAERLTASGWTVFFYAHANARERVSATGAVWCHYGSSDWDLFATAKRATVDLLEMAPDALLDMSIVSSGLPATLAMLPYLLDEIDRRQPRFAVHDAAAPWGALAAGISGCNAVCSMSAFPLLAEQAAETYPPGPIQNAAAQYLLRHYGASYDPRAGYTNYTGFNLVFTSRHWAGERFNGDTAHHFCGPTPIGHAPGASDHASVQIARAARAAGKKVVYASCGTVVSGTLNAYYEPAMHQIFTEIIEGLRERDDVQLILSAGRKAACGSGVVPRTCEPLPDFVSCFDYTPQSEVLAYTDLFVTHAGMNSTNEAAWHGVPVVCCPFFGDGPFNAHRFVELGAGITIDYRIATPAQVAKGHAAFLANHQSQDAMRSALGAVLDDPSYREAASRLKDEFRRESNLDSNIDAMLEWVTKRA